MMMKYTSPCLRNQKRLVRAGCPKIAKPSSNALSDMMCGGWTEEWCPQCCAYAHSINDLHQIAAPALKQSSSQDSRHRMT